MRFHVLHVYINNENCVHAISSRKPAANYAISRFQEARGKTEITVLSFFSLDTLYALD